MDWREFRQSAGKVVRVWRIKVEGANIYTQWGQLDGVIQEAVETKEGVNIGKKNEISPADYAADRAEETIRKKKREGYREYTEGECIDVDKPSAIDFDKELPENLCFYKPDNSMGPGITAKAEVGEVYYTRKRNGLAYVIVKDSSGKIKMYSRRMLRYHDLQPGEHPWEERFPSITKEANEIMPNKSILLGELIVDRKGKDDFKAVQSITKTIHPECIARIKEIEKDGGKVKFYMWDIAFWDGKDLVSNTSYETRLDLMCKVTNDEKDIIHVQAFPIITLEHAMQMLKKTAWEGFVVVDPEGVYGEKAFNFKGKPDRPRSFCAKLKPEFEDDFIAMWNPPEHGEKSTKGRYNGGIKSVSLYQYNSKGELVYIANCASGMTEEMKRDWAKPELYPQVWQVIYTDRRYISQGDDTNAIDFPRFSMVRTDKKPEECINTDLD